MSAKLNACRCHIDEGCKKGLLDGVGLAETTHTYKHTASNSVQQHNKSRWR